MANPSSKNEIHFTSIVVQLRRDHATELADTIGKIPSAEIHMEDRVGKLVVGFETKTIKEVTDYISTITTMPGVISAVLVYHHIEDETLLDELIDVERPAQPHTQNSEVTP